MDLVLRVCDDLFLDKVWAKLVPVSAFTTFLAPSHFSNSSLGLPVANIGTWTQFISFLPHPPMRAAELSAYYSTSSPLSANQVKLEIQTSLRSFPGMTLLTLPWFQAEVMGYSKLYDGLDTYGYFYLFASIPLFLLFTDYCIYWIHRWLHVPFLYKFIHKPHHKWLVPTPFASHAFHPVDGYLQSVPYHLFIFFFPLHRTLYLVLFVLVNLWSILIHDSDMITGHPLEKVINGPAHHTLHHLYFTVNYGQYFTWADRYGGSYRQPESHLDPLLE
ncbi:fatty acid hydroxylase, partial [Amanita rubescens]